MTWAPWSSHVTRKENAGPGPRGDKFLSFLILRFFYIVIPAQAGIHCVADICVARALMRPVRILVFVQTALALVFTYSDSLRGKNKFLSFHKSFFVLKLIS